MKTKGKFQSLEHSGPLFPKEFDEMAQVTVNNVTYKGLPLEMLYAYARYLDTDYVKEATFNKNFLNDFTVECKKAGVKVLSFPNDYKDAFATMRTIQTQIKEAKKNLSKEQKAAEKATKDQIKAQYGFATINGVSQQIGNYMIEPPGIFMARGKSPVKGCWKYRVNPEDVTINCTANTPVAPKGHSWKKVENNSNALYTFAFDIHIGQKVITPKHIRFSYSSDIGQSADQHKFEKAEELVRNWTKMQDYIWQNYTYSKQALHKDDQITIESAVIAWLIQNTSIRIGHDRDENAAQDVVGVSTLCVKNVSLTSDGAVHSLNLSFVGKDSIVYKNSFAFGDMDMARRLKALIDNRNPNDKLFKATANDVNTFLQKCLDNTSAKMFRPACGTSILVEELKKLNVNKTDSVSAKVLAFTKANIKTSELLNHKKAVSKNHDTGVQKLDDTIKAAKDRLAQLKKEEKEKSKKFATDIAAIKKAFSGDKQKEALKRIKAKIEKLAERVTKAEERVTALQNKMMIKKDTKETSLGTAKGSYLDPRVLVSWAKDVDLPIEKLYTKSLLGRFSWALNVDAGFWKTYTR